MRTRHPIPSRVSKQGFKKGGLRGDPGGPTNGLHHQAAAERSRVRAGIPRQPMKSPFRPRLPITLHPGRAIDSGGIEGSRQRDRARCFAKSVPPRRRLIRRSNRDFGRRQTAAIAIIGRIRNDSPRDRNVTKAIKSRSANVRNLCRKPALPVPAPDFTRRPDSTQRPPWRTAATARRPPSRRCRPAP